MGPKPRPEAPLGLLDAMTTCRDCKDWDMLHDLAMNVAAPRLILEDKEGTLLSLLQVGLGFVCVFVDPLIKRVLLAE